MWRAEPSTFLTVRLFFSRQFGVFYAESVGRPSPRISTANSQCAVLRLLPPSSREIARRVVGADVTSARDATSGHCPDDGWTPPAHTKMKNWVARRRRRRSPPCRAAAVPRLLGELARALLGRALALAARARLLLFEVDARRPELVFPLLRLQPLRRDLARSSRNSLDLNGKRWLLRMRRSKSRLFARAMSSAYSGSYLMLRFLTARSSSFCSFGYCSGRGDCGLRGPSLVKARLREEEPTWAFSTGAAPRRPRAFSAVQAAPAATRSDATRCDSMRRRLRCAMVFYIRL